MTAPVESKRREVSSAGVETALRSKRHARVPRLLVFSLGPREERARRPLLPNAIARHELALRRGCLERTLAAGRHAGCELVISSPRRLTRAPDVTHCAQRGRDFGSRLTHALAETTREAPGVWLLAGSDTPDFDKRHVDAALASLAIDPEAVVLGPSKDGGVYLIAAQRELGALLDGVRWCTRHVITDLAGALASAGIPVVWLETLGDLDSPRDLARWLASPRARTLAWTALVTALLAAFDAARRIGRRALAPRPHSGFARSRGTRAPPAAHLA